MRNPNKPLPKIDDTPKTKAEIAEMIERMMSTDENGYSNDKSEEKSKNIA